MIVKRLSGQVLLALAFLAGIGGSPAAQVNVTSADVQRLQDNIYEASRDVAQARSREAVLASQLQGELDDARDETIYLKVKLRKNEPIARSRRTTSRSGRNSTYGCRAPSARRRRRSRVASKPRR